MQTLDCQFCQLFIKISFAPHPGGLEAWRPGGLEAGGLEAWGPGWRPGGLEAWRPEAWKMQTLDCQLFIKISFAHHPGGLEAWGPGGRRPEGGLEA